MKQDGDMKGNTETFLGSIFHHCNNIGYVKVPEALTLLLQNEIASAFHRNLPKETK